MSEQTGENENPSRNCYHLRWYLSTLWNFLWRFALVYTLVVLVLAFGGWTSGWQVKIGGTVIVGVTFGWCVLHWTRSDREQTNG